MEIQSNELNFCIEHGAKLSITAGEFRDTDPQMELPSSHPLKTPRIRRDAVGSRISKHI